MFNIKSILGLSLVLVSQINGCEQTKKTKYCNPNFPVGHELRYYTTQCQKNYNRREATRRDKLRFKKFKQEQPTNLLNMYGLQPKLRPTKIFSILAAQQKYENLIL